jgi:hypothetical protein
MEGMQSFHGCRRRRHQGRVEQCDAPASGHAMDRNYQLTRCEQVQTIFMQVRERDVSQKRDSGESFEKQLGR